MGIFSGSEELTNLGDVVRVYSGSELIFDGSGPSGPLWQYDQNDPFVLSGPDSGNIQFLSDRINLPAIITNSVNYAAINLSADAQPNTNYRLEGVLEHLGTADVTFLSIWLGTTENNFDLSNFSVSDGLFDLEEAFSTNGSGNLWVTFRYSTNGSFQNVAGYFANLQIVEVP